MRTGVCLCMLAVFLAYGKPACAQEEVEAAMEHFGEGVKKFGGGDYAGALKEFKVSFKLKPHWKIRFNIAMCCYELGRYVETAGELSKFLHEGGDKILEKPKKRALEVFSDVKKRVGIIRFGGEAEDAVIEVDGKEVTRLEAGQQVFVEPGEHHVYVRYGGEVVLDEDVSIEAGTAREIVTTVVEKAEEPEEEMEVEEAEPAGGPPAGPGKGLRTGGYVTAAAAAVSLVVGGVLGGLVLKEKGSMKDAEDEYLELHEDDPGDPRLAELVKERDDHYDTAGGYALGANVLFPLGGALAVTSVVMFVMASKKKKETRIERATLLPGPGSLSLEVRF